MCEDNLGYQTDYQLQQLVTEAQQSPVNSLARRRILNELIKLIQNSGQLSKHKRWRELPNFEDLYREAMDDTFIELCQKIDKYNPQYPVIVWVNNLFNWRFQDVINKYRNRLPILPLDGDESTKEENLFKDFVDDRKEERLLEGRLFREFVKSDPEGIFQEIHIRNDSNASLKVILLMLLNEEEWQNISQILGHSISTLSSFYQRSIKKRNIVDYARKYLQ
jgi:hypothetical protein